MIGWLVGFGVVVFSLVSSLGLLVSRCSSLLLSRAREGVFRKGPWHSVCVVLINSDMFFDFGRAGR